MVTRGESVGRLVTVTFLASEPLFFAKYLQRKYVTLFYSLVICAFSPQNKTH